MVLSRILLLREINIQLFTGRVNIASKAMNKYRRRHLHIICSFDMNAWTSKVFIRARVFGSLW